MMIIAGDEPLRYISAMAIAADTLLGDAVIIHIATCCIRYAALMPLIAITCHTYMLLRIRYSDKADC